LSRRRRDGQKNDVALSIRFRTQHRIQGEALIGDEIDGASIPEIIWSKIIGTPSIIDYRRAKVVDDVACKNHTRTSREAHRMFYEAMLKDDTDSLDPQGGFS
jgi:Protein of unknown function (DUF1353)